jgi:putative aldouronate transport system permease protein
MNTRHGSHLQKRRLGDLSFDVFNTVLMGVVLVVTSYPFIYILCTSLSRPEFLDGRLLIFPRGFTLDSYVACFQSANVLGGMVVSIERTLAGALSTVFVTSMLAYVMSKKYLVGHKFFTRFLILTMYFNSGLIPVYVLMSQLHLSGTFWVYIVPNLVNVFELVLVRTYIESLPPEVDEAARIDGANDYVVLFRIVLPLCMPVLAAILLFEAIGQWNAFTDTLLYNTSNEKLHTMQYVLMTFLYTTATNVQIAHSAGSATPKMYSSQSLRMSMTILTVVPIFLVYPFLQKYFVKGLLVGAIKG